MDGSRVSLVERVRGWVEGVPFLWVAAFCLLSVLVLGGVDLANGPDLSLSLFYLIPVSAAAWWAGRWFSVAVSLVSALVAWMVNLPSGFPPSEASAWNAALLLGFFLVTLELLVRLKGHSEREKLDFRRDPLTGCLNGLGFSERAQMAFGQAKRTGRPLTMIFIDLDDFKLVNDRRGRSEGDRLLQSLGETLEWNLRSYDLAARMGGDEFAVLLPETGFAGGQAFLAGLRERVSRLFSQNGWPVTMSVGAVTFIEPPSGLDQAVRMADGLMYRAKGEGKDRVIHLVHPVGQGPG
jgi:diguanylate cyclase (GGDEF)-like protein